MLEWAKDLTLRNVQKTGAACVDWMTIKPPATQRLEEIQVPMAVCIGAFDEQETNDAMHFLARKRDVQTKVFEAAHVPSLECEDEFNAWLEVWLENAVQA